MKNNLLGKVIIDGKSKTTIKYIETIGSNEKNLNPNNAVEKEIEKANSKALKQQQQQVRVNRKMRKVVKQIRKVTDGAARKARRRIALVTDGSQDKMGTMLTEGLKKVDDFLNSLPVSNQNTNKDQKEDSVVGS